MSTFWTVVLDIVVFILSLGVLICIHEAGHLSMAKAFKVYCYEFSIGMGPILYQKKPKRDKGQETAFSIRAVPVGGYVSMAGEDLEDAENVDKTVVVPKDRTLEGKAYWKRIIIMAAGVTMNFILAFVMFVIQYTATPQTRYYYDSNAVVISDSSFAQSVGLLQTGDKVTAIQIDYYKINEATGVVSTTAAFSVPKTAVTCYGFEEEPSDHLELNHAINYLLGGYYFTSSTQELSDAKYTPAAEGDLRKVTFTYDRGGVESTAPVITTKAYYAKSTIYSKSALTWETIGIGCSYENYMLSFGEGLKAAGDAWAYGCSAIFVGVGKLFTPAGWKSAGGVVAIFQVSSYARSMGIQTYLYLWGMISVNLAIMNLLPFPGLDGWQILVTVIDWISNGVKKIRYKTTIEDNKKLSDDEKAMKLAEQEKKDALRKKRYDKAKRIASTVGLIILLVLAALLVVKDLIFPAV
jgi:regulator of sigma E protease